MTGSLQVRKIDAEWAKCLSTQQYRVLREGATEAPYSSLLAREAASGRYRCAGCGAVVFRSGDKFESRSGWPSFAAAAMLGDSDGSGGGGGGHGREGSSAVRVERSALEALTGAAVRCATCDGRLGERFLDGARYPGTLAARTKQAFLVNGAALVFVPADGSPAKSGDALLRTGRYGQQEGDVESKFKSAGLWRMQDGGLRPI
jgi:peptide-methionine (R)-S-oxide reductase